MSKAQTMGDILEKIRKVLADKDHITREQWDSICAIYVTVYTRKWGEYLAGPRDPEGLQSMSSGQYYEIDHERIAEKISLKA